jgi:hypothetical protein
MSWLVGGLLHASLVQRRRVELAGWFRAAVVDARGRQP